MVGGTKVRLVRCPKCQNLLPELPDYTVYKCGGCEAVLRAKKKVTMSDGSTEQIGKERDGEASEKLDIYLEKDCGAHGIEGDSDGVINSRIKESRFSERALNLVSSSSPITEKIEALAHNSCGDVEERNLGYRGGPEKEINSGDKYRLHLKQKITNYVGHGDDQTNTGRSEPGNARRKEGIGETSAQLKSSAGSLRPKVVMDQCGLDRHANPRIADDWSKFSTFVYPDEGPSNYYLDSSYGYGMPVKHYGELNGSNPVADPGNSRAELLRKLNELKEEINKSCVVDEEQQRRTPVSRKTSPVDPYYGQVDYGVPMQPMAPNEHIIPPYVEQYGHRPALHGKNWEMNMQNFYVTPRHGPGNFATYDSPFQLQMPGVHRHQPPYDRFSAQYTDLNREHFSSYPHDNSYHQTSCSCFHCYSKNWHFPSQVPTNAFGDKKFPKDPLDSNFNRHFNSPTFGLQTCNPAAEPSAWQLRSQQPHSRSPNDVDSDSGGIRQSPLSRFAVNHGKRQNCLPTAGGAPFVTCCNCFELLKLPKRLKPRERSQQKLRCGACSMISVVKIENNRLIVSLPSGNKSTVDEDGDNGSHESSKEISLSSNGCLNAGVTSCPTDADDPKCDDHNSMESKFNKVSKEQKPNQSETEKRRDLTSSSISSEEEVSLSRRKNHRDISSAELTRIDQDPNSQEHSGDRFSNHAAREISTSTSFIFSEEEKSLSRRNIYGDISSAELTRADRDSHFQEHLTDIRSNHAANRYREGNGSKQMNEEKAILDKDSCQHDSVEDKSMATEVEVSFQESLDASLSQDSLEVSIEEDQSRVKKWSESLLTGIIRRSSRDSSRTRQLIKDEKVNVFVNGQPIPDFVVKHAEMRAGPIQPGDYWYDFRAGFWGVMGHACLGIIPPHIEEFNYPLPANCAAGDTGVFVNGRQLHKKDLDLLASRGLPTTRDKLYIIEISGRVLDEDSGEEICNLGKLAPTVQKLKRGFGMKLPKRKESDQQALSKE